MTISCSHVLSNITYSCANPWGQGCTSPDGFQLDTLWTYTQSIYAACPSDQRLFLDDKVIPSLQSVSLTQKSCQAIAGTGWTLYPPSDIWIR